MQDSIARANTVKPRLMMTKLVRTASAALVTLLSPLHDRLKVKHASLCATFCLGVLQADVRLDGCCLNLRGFTVITKLSSGAEGLAAKQVLLRTVSGGQPSSLSIVSVKSRAVRSVQTTTTCVPVIINEQECQAYEGQALGCHETSTSTSAILKRSTRAVARSTRGAKTD